jgi:hypothetical protein
VFQLLSGYTTNSKRPAPTTQPAIAEVETVTFSFNAPPTHKRGRRISRGDISALARMTPEEKIGQMTQLELE